MNSIEIIKKEAYNKNNVINNLLNNDSTKLTLKDIIKSINEVYFMKKQYEGIIKKELLINKLTNNIDNFFTKFNINNKYKRSIKNNILHKSFSKFTKNINYINSLFFVEENQFNEYSIKKFTRNNLNDTFFIIFSIILIKKCINYNEHIFIQKYSKISENFIFISIF